MVLNNIMFLGLEKSKSNGFLHQFQLKPTAAGLDPAADAVLDTTRDLREDLFVCPREHHEGWIHARVPGCSRADKTLMLSGMANLPICDRLLHFWKLYEG